MGQEWLDYLVQNRIPFYIRIIDQRLVEWGTQNPRKLREFFDHLEPDEERHLFKAISTHNLTIAGRRNKKGELIVVISNDTNHKKILKIYKDRWRIETLFRNTKKGGFNMEDTHMTQSDRLMKLMALVAIGVAMTICAGLEIVKTRPSPFKNTVQSLLFSTFTRGLRFLRSAFLRQFHTTCKWLAKLLSPRVSKVPMIRSVR